MIKDDHLVLEHLLNVLFCVKVEPVFKTDSAKLVVHLLLLKEVNLLSLLTVALRVQANELKQQVLSNLVHGLSHEDLTFKLWMHG